MGWSLRTIADLSDAEFLQWAKLLEERAGIQLSLNQKSLLQSQLSIRMRELGYDSYAEYYSLVTDGLQGRLEWSILIDRVAVKETSFFRHRASFEFVRRYLQDKINNQQLTSSFDAWSVGCSTGEEPYSLAMVINDCFELAQLEPYYGVTALDISSTALAKGRLGRFMPRSIEQMTAEESKRYCQLGHDGTYEVVRKIRDRVCFTYGNVLQINDMPAVQMDVIFCQNLLVYFRRWLRRDILNSLVDRLKPGGTLVIGIGEVVDWEHPKLKRIANEEVQAYVRQ
ncbi:protein-glutamate O-methyltransferase CheR [Gilvimarinus sp. SDUM040013]|uniref:protein-glutamate O-methyltransferase n=1 Tax=Gilvimarinus gilvus TaxID=3058038 RepID=A0ABU4RZ11_9GAMM|nr:protein-glutamate O-methyltransferase CheR [Gilvimarinus sp. SDUM040013]MDO3387585.1 protein-glutamate O-methyltransferase CheR [Gilvimarinus sp. SDUM040013]MDX6850150.1 protein-glutamate O-methyltransferase CheR [Gilvimarinus sp. SDUM040013]